MRLRILKEVNLKRDATCPYCKNVAATAGALVEIVQDMNTNEQYACFSCQVCKEHLMLQ